jgi:hypothetical protein
MRGWRALASDALPSPDEHRGLPLAPSTVAWALDDEGRLLRQDAGTPRMSRSECRVVTRLVRDPGGAVPGLPGDLLLTDQGEDERPITRRLLRKMGAGE